MSHALTTAPDALVPPGTNAAIEQPFGAVADPHRPYRPNILVVHADLGAPLIGAYAGDVATTPNIDRLARSGTRFTAVAGEPGTSAVRDVLDPLAERGFDVAYGGCADAAIAFLGIRRQAPWAAYVWLQADDADDGVGALATALRKSEQYRRTVVLLSGAAGYATPTLLSWPGQIAPRQRHDEPIACIDWVPTLLETAEPGSTRDLPVQGVDLTTHLFDGGPVPARPAIRHRQAA